MDMKDFAGKIESVRRRLGANRSPQMRRARPGIRSGFPLARYKGTPVNEVEAWSARGRFLFRQVARTLWRLKAPAGEEALDDERQVERRLRKCPWPRRL
jgi:hypothetical protein